MSDFEEHNMGAYIASLREQVAARDTEIERLNGETLRWRDSHRVMTDRIARLEADVDSYKRWSDIAWKIIKKHCPQTVIDGITTAIDAGMGMANAR